VALFRGHPLHLARCTTWRSRNAYPKQTSRPPLQKTYGFTRPGGRHGRLWQRPAFETNHFILSCKQLRAATQSKGNEIRVTIGSAWVVGDRIPGETGRVLQRRSPVSPSVRAGSGLPACNAASAFAAPPAGERHAGPPGKNGFFGAAQTRARQHRSVLRQEKYERSCRLLPARRQRGCFDSPVRGKTSGGILATLRAAVHLSGAPWFFVRKRVPRCRMLRGTFCRLWPLGRHPRPGHVLAPV